MEQADLEEAGDHPAQNHPHLYHEEEVIELQPLFPIHSP